MQVGLYHLIAESGVQSLRILEIVRVFPADYLHWSDCHLRCFPQVPPDSSGFPAYSQIYFRNYDGQFIVTAAVYWGFPSKLCLAANPSG